MGVDYTLYDGLTPIGSSVAGTANDIDFIVSNATATKVYIVKGKSDLFGGACLDYFIDTAKVVTTPIPLDVALETNPMPANICAGKSLEIIVKGTQIGMNYQLRSNGVSVPGQLITGDGNDQSFVVFPTVSDNYTVFVEPISTARISSSIKFLLKW